jgi:hypothetical protein
MKSDQREWGGLGGFVSGGGGRLKAVILDVQATNGQLTNLFVHLAKIYSSKIFIAKGRGG